MRLHGIPFLTASEFIRAKMKAWIMYAVRHFITHCLLISFYPPSRGAEHDAQDILYVLNHYWSVVDINRINEQDMNIFVSRYPGAAVPWLSIQKKYGM